MTRPTVATRRRRRRTGAAEACQDTDLSMYKNMLEEDDRDEEDSDNEQDDYDRLLVDDEDADDDDDCYDVVHEDKNPPLHETEDPVAIVRAYLQATQQQQDAAAAAQYLHEEVQASYPGLPYIDSLETWQQVMFGNKNAQGNNVNIGNNNDNNIAWQVLQVGAHPLQVIRRGRSLSCRHQRHSNTTLLEVFELEEKRIGSMPQDKEESRNDDTDSTTESPRLGIVSMYLRLAPRNWAPPGLFLPRQRSSSSSSTRRRRRKQRPSLRKSKNQSSQRSVLSVTLHTSHTVN